MKITASLTPANATGGVVYSTSNSSVATVTNKGVIKAVGKGNAVITVRTASGKTDTIKVIVGKKKVKVKKLKLTGPKSIKVGQTKKLKVKVTTNKATATLTYKSSKSSVLKVNAWGYMTGLKKGKATITVKSSTGKKAKIKIKVN